MQILGMKRYRRNAAASGNVNAKREQMEPQTFPDCIIQFAVSEFASLAGVVEPTMEARAASFCILCLAASQPLPKGRIDIVVIYLPVEGIGGGLQTGRK